MLSFFTRPDLWFTHGKIRLKIKPYSIQKSYLYLKHKNLKT